MEEKFKKLIEDFKKIDLLDADNVSILDILGYKETKISNLLRYFFDTKRGHNLKDLLVKSLLEAYPEEVNITDYNTKHIYMSDFQTMGNGRLDILFRGENFVVGIENKLYADLYNDLNDYSNSIDEEAKKHNKEHKFKIVLSITNKDIPNDNDFKNITYADFFEKINQNLPAYIYNAHPKYLLFLNDFMNTIQRPNIMSNQELVTFLQENNEDIDELIQKYDEFKTTIFNEFKGKVEQKVESKKLEEGFAIRYVHKFTDGKKYAIVIIRHNEVDYNVEIHQKLLNNKIAYEVYHNWPKNDKIVEKVNQGVREKEKYESKAHGYVVNEEDMLKLVFDIFVEEIIKVIKEDNNL